MTELDWCEVHATADKEHEQDVETGTCVYVHLIDDEALASLREALAKYDGEGFIFVNSTAVIQAARALCEGKET
jgi:hypothetical protein